MSNLHQQVIDFHRAMNIPIAETPTLISQARVRLRAALILEECIETLESLFDCSFQAPKSMILNKCALANVKVNMPLLADGMADLDYVVEGTRIEFGIAGDSIAAEVHRANMTKVGGPKAPNGKQLKPEGWKPPDIEGVLKRQGWNP